LWTSRLKVTTVCIGRLTTDWVPCRQTDCRPMFVHCCLSHCVRPLDVGLAKFIVYTFSVELEKSRPVLTRMSLLTGFSCIADDEGQTALRAVSNTLLHLQHVASTWSRVLPTNAYYKSIGTLYCCFFTSSGLCLLYLSRLRYHDLDF